MFHLFGPLAFSEVRKQVERTVAQLAAWSISISSPGIAPSVGFAGEAFDRNSTRFQMRGKQLASGFKTLVRSHLIQ